MLFWHATCLMPTVAFVLPIRHQCQRSPTRGRENAPNSRSYKPPLGGGDMTIEFTGQLKGEFKGWDGQTVFEFTNGMRWRPKRNGYMHCFRFMPHAKVWKDRGEYLLEIADIDEKIPVVR